MDKLKQWVALTVVGCLGIMAAGWFLLISPKKAEAEDLRTQAASQDSANAQLRTQLEVLKAQAKDLPKKQADLARVAAKIPGDPALPSLIRALTAAGTSAGVQLVSVTPGTPAAYAAAAAVAGAAPAPLPPLLLPTRRGSGRCRCRSAGGPAGTLAQIPLTLNVVGGYFEVAQFMANLENLPRALRVTDLAWRRAPRPPPASGAGDNADGSSLTTTITGSVFMAADRPEAAPVAAPVAAPAS